MQESLRGIPPPSLPSTATGRWRPFVPLTLFGPSTSWFFNRALVDSGSDDTVFPLNVAKHLGVPLLVDSGHVLRWRGQVQPLRFGIVELNLVDANGNSLHWPATVAFTTSVIPYPLLGVSGCLEFMDAKFLGKDRILELEPNADFP